MTQITEQDIERGMAAAEPIEQPHQTTVDGAVVSELVETRTDTDKLAKRPMNVMVPIDPQSGKLAPRDFAGVFLVAQFMMDAGHLPDAYWGNDRQRRTPKQVLAVAMSAIFQGRKHDMDPFEAIRWHLPIRNSLTLWGDAVPGVVVAKLRKLGERREEEVKYTGEGEKRVCTVTVNHLRGADVLGSISRSFSWADATKANLTGKGPWKSSPDRMLMHRARTYAYRDLFPDLMMGLTVAEEAQDVEVEVEARERVSLDERLAAAKDKNEPGAA